MIVRCLHTSSAPRRIHDPSAATFVRVAGLPGFALHRPRGPASLAPATPASLPRATLGTLAAASGSSLPAPPVATTGHPGAIQIP